MMGFSQCTAKSLAILLVSICLCTVSFSQRDAVPQLKLAGEAEIPEEHYQAWLQIQQSPETSDDSKIRSTIDTYFHVMYQSWLHESLWDFGFLFDHKDPKATADYAYERGRLYLHLARWKNNGVSLMGYEYSPKYDERDKRPDQVDLYVHPEATLKFADSPDLPEPAPSILFIISLKKSEGRWLITGIRCRSLELDIYPRNSDFEDIAANLPAHIEFSEMESESYKSLKRQIEQGNPRAARRWKEYARFEEIDSHLLTLEDVKRQLKWKNIVRIIKFDHRFLLVEIQKPTLANQFDFFDLGSGEHYRMPTSDLYVDLYKIYSYWRIVFHATGRNHNTPTRGVPSIVECTRPAPGTPFRAQHKKRVFPVASEIEFGMKAHAVVFDARITVHGIEVAFGPQEGFEQHFYAGHSDIPVTHTQYDRDTHSLIVLFSDTLLPKDESTLASVLSQSNFNISSVQVEQRDQECVFIIQLEPKAKYFTAYRQISHRYPMAAFEFHSGAPEIYD